MKKIFVLILILFLLPISVFARQETKERLFNAIEDIHNVQVDDTIEIINMKVEEDTILLEMLEDDKSTTHRIHYDFIDTYLLFDSGYVTMQKSANGSVRIENPKENNYAFYLYSILESLSTAPYEEENYYNNTQIVQKLENLSPEEKKSFWGTPSKKLEYYNTGKTFGLQLIGDTIDTSEVKVKIYYQYFLDGDDTILVNPIVEAGKNELLTNPETGSYNFFITTLLLIVIGLAAYTYMNPGEEKHSK